MITGKPQIVGSALRQPTSPRGYTPTVVTPVPVAETPPGYRIAKRSFDILVSALLLILLSPLLLIIYLAIILDDGGPAVIVQKRVGMGGEVFDFYKFRSMVVGVNHTAKHREFAQQVIRGEIVKGPTSNGGILKPTGDKRVITRVGRILRKTSLDELPQLVNVLIGNMSFIGPRPSMQYEVEAYYDWYLPRLAVLPGMTGLAQIHGRSSIPFPEIVRWDLEYVRTRSFWVDAKILLRTPLVVLSMRYSG